jgi:hypothetical protein
MQYPVILTHAVSKQLEPKRITHMKTISKDTKTFKLFTALKAGEKLTPAEAEKRFGIKNIAAEASRIRQHGYAVYANSRKAGNNVVVTEYELGRPSREIVALGYLAKNLGMSV